MIVLYKQNAAAQKIPILKRIFTDSDMFMGLSKSKDMLTTKRTI